MKLSDFSIGAKLRAAFLAVLLLNAGVGVFSIVELGRLHASVEDLGTDALPGVRHAGAIKSEVNEMRRAEARHLLSSEPKLRQDAETRIAAARKGLDAAQARYAALPLTDAERAQLERMQSHLTEYLAVQPRMIAASRDPAGGEAARALYAGAGSRALRAVLDDLGELVALNDAQAEVSVAMSRDVYTGARSWVVGLLIAAAAAALVMSGWTTRLVTRPIVAAVDTAGRIAEGDLTAGPPVSGLDEPARLLRALAAMQSRLADTVAAVRRNADGVATASAQIAQGNADLSSRTEQQTSALQQTAASMEELGTSVAQNAESAREADLLARSATDVAERGGATVSRVVDTMRGISESSREIAEIVGTIDAIAFQTNILALNASVEAARAGEQGRGFAVVASEVRVLAQRAAEAAKQIRGLIGSSVERIEAGSRLADEAGATMTQVMESIRRVGDRVAQISAASAEQSQGLTQVGEAVTQMDEATQHNAALVEQSGAAAESLKAQSRRLVDAVGVFRTA